MNTLPFLRIAPFSLVGVSLMLLPGCFFILDGEDDDGEITVIENSSPFLVEDLSYWNCDLDEGVGEYFFEFQTAVEDLDGLGDIDQVDVTVQDVETGAVIDSFSLIDEGDGIYGGLVWESESALYCGEPQDVLFEVWDFAGGYDSLILYY